MLSKVDPGGEELTIKSALYANRSYLPPHMHDVHQLAFSMDGHMRVSTTTDVWQIPPSSAIWIPPALRHEVLVQERSTVFFIHLHEATRVELPVCAVAEVAPLVRELVAYLTTPNRPLEEAHQACLIALLREQLAKGDPTHSRMRLPTDRRAARVARALREQPDDHRSLQDWASLVGASERTLSRVFEQETGVSFRKWQQRCRLMRAAELLSSGTPVSQAAPAVGYESLSAFIKAFSKEFGSTPREFATARALGGINV